MDRRKTSSMQHDQAAARDTEPAPELTADNAVSVATATPKATKRRWLWITLTLVTLILIGSGYPLLKWYQGEQLEAACRQALRAKNWEQLATLAARYSDWQSQQAAPWMYRAQAAHELGQIAESADYLDRLPDHDRRTPAALLERATLLFGPLNRPLDAEQTCLRALRLNPSLVDAHRRLIYFYAFTLQRQKMVAQIRKAIEYECDLPETYIYLLSQDWLSFGNAYQENTRWMQSDRDSELFLVARAIYRVTTQGLDEKPDNDTVVVEDDTEGLPYHRKVLQGYFEKFPQNLELLVFYLRQASNDGDQEQVSQLLAQAPAAAAQDNRFWRYQGWLHQARGELAEAEESYRTALKLNPYDHISPHQLAAVLRRRQAAKEEIDELERRYQEGSKLRREILALPDVTKAPPTLLTRIAEHAVACGESQTAEQLRRRLELIRRMR
jgi:tetratricopeptide (TPR) repeat protein